MNGFVFIVIAIVILLMRKFITPSKKELPRTAGRGIVRKRIQRDAIIYFFVEFQDKNGKTFVGESIPYKSTKGKYQIGEPVNILYYFSPKGTPFVIIDDDELVSLEGNANVVAKVMLIAAIVFFAIGVFTLVF